MDSLICQTIQPIEIIVVNDGSTDNTLEIATQYAIKHPEIIVINQANAGVSSARNNAILRATGEYIGFCDADDYVDPDMYYDLFHMSIEKTDIVCCGYYREALHLSAQHLPPYPSDTIFSREFIQNSLLSNIFYDKEEKLDGIFSVVNKLYRRKLIIENDILFPSDWDHAEDINFNVQALINANSIIFSSKAYYHYVKEIRKKSLTSKPRPDFFATELRYRKFLEQTIGPVLNIDFENTSGWLSLIEKAETNAINLCRKEFDPSVRKQWLDYIFNNDDYRHCITLCNDNQLSPSQRKEKICVEQNNYAEWVQVINTEAKAANKIYYRKIVSKIFRILFHK